MCLFRLDPVNAFFRRLGPLVELIVLDAPDPVAGGNLLQALDFLFFQSTAASVRRVPLEEGLPRRNEGDAEAVGTVPPQEQGPASGPLQEGPGRG